jgi:sec-independent protein translocase protein TatA
MFGPWQIVLIFLVVVLLFGAKRIPDLAGSLGKGIKEFKKATKEEEKDKLKEGDKKEEDKKD